MRDVLPALERWAADRQKFALATVTQTWGSSPRPIGACMGVRADRMVCGSVSGGCVESAVIDEALNALQDGKPRELTFERVSDETAWQVGLSCGGRIQVWIDPAPNERDPALWSDLVEKAYGDERFVLATCLDPFRQTLTPADNRQTGVVETEGAKWFYNVLGQRDRLIVVGAVHLAIALVKFAKDLGFETIVIDPRAAFTAPERFPAVPDHIVVRWPEPALEDIDLTPDTYCVVLTHDPKIDNPALAVFLRHKVKYIGALGSRTTHAQRVKELTALGFSETDIKRVHGPVGISIGAKTPEEIALSIIAEMVMVRRA